MATDLGDLIKSARTGAKLTQSALADIVGVSASDISKAERGEKSLPQSVLKLIAKATGVTQSSLLNALKEGAELLGKKKPAAAKDDFKLAAAEKKLVELYRAADEEVRDKAVKLLRDGKLELSDVLGSIVSADKLGELLGDGKLGNLLGGDGLGNLLGMFKK